MDAAALSARNTAGSTSFPDLMNDPVFDEREKGLDDMDTCRICHGEATEQEPLFYPCKCSGSIKFVHQNCLVEWLSHSQKKHCELCKTPFRFTKLYDPNMPQSLPTPLFIRQASIQCCRTVITWLRFVLVAFVWLGWLPWSMRAIWRALFWLADGCWSNSGPPVRSAGALGVAVNSTTTITGVYSLTSTMSNTIESSAGAVTSAQASDSSYQSAEPLMLSLIKKVVPSLFIPALSSSVGNNSSNINSTIGSQKLRYPSWLSDVKFLNTLTPYPTINNMIIDTLEGQLITLLVVVAFILLFLIREWVVQQQPMANIAEGEREAALQLIANANNLVNQPVHGPQPAANPNRPNIEAPQNAVNDATDDDMVPRSTTASPAPSWSDSDDGGSIFDRQDGHPISFSRDTARLDMERDHGSPSSQRLDEARRSGVAVFRDVVARANGDPNELLRIVQEEGLEQDVEWILDSLPRASASRQNPDTSDLEDDLNNAESSHDPGPSHQAIGPMLDPHQSRPGEPSTAQSPDNEASTLGEAAPMTPQVNDQYPRGATERLVDWFWGDIDSNHHDHAEADPDDEHIVEDPALEDPFVPVRNRLHAQPEEGAMPAEVADAGLDPNDMDPIEGDDFEGIMDLIGMQGPIFGLLQNGVFCALLIAFTVAVGIWLPYLWGKIALVLLANPLELIVGVPMTAVTVVADITLDTLIGVLGYVMYWLSFIFKVLLSPFASIVSFNEWVPQGKSVTSASLSLIDASTHRLNKVVRAFLVFHESDIPMFSVLSHQALRLHQARLIAIFESAVFVTKFMLHDFPLRLVSLGVPGALSFDFEISQLRNLAIDFWQHMVESSKALFFSNSSSMLMDESVVKATAAAASPIDYELAVWDTKDRIIAIALGYTLAIIVGFLYLRITQVLAGGNHDQRAEGVVAEVLRQAGGVMKVILIIGIEMIVFPLYCGTLLDVALLPLFSEGTITSRIAFTAAAPLTSLFVHWFIGTCYMFHFALFVSMCRKILRTGVLYFIRDPDDPTFHPIRDVLERSITTQLRKIGFSALVYGTLVIVCLGGVVWGIHFAFDEVLPIHWSSSAPMLEFPVDLLFYNFVVPLVLQSLKPSDGLHKLYDWWFHQCARLLRLSNFFFSEKRPEEEGRHVRRTWWGILAGSKGDWDNPVNGQDQRTVAENEMRDVYFLRDGKYVRAPASDQVRIPKGTQVFLEVNENNERVDGKPDLDEGLHGRSSTMFAKVYIPPYFRTRIAAFILLIWLFAAATGVGITIIPLVIGRKVVSTLFSSPVPVNDIYAFSSGICVLGALGYLAYYCRAALLAVRNHRDVYHRSPRELAQLGAELILGAGRLAYISTTLLIMLPTLFALLTELYILIPAHTLFGDKESHVVHIVQDWTLGVLYVQMAIKLTLWHPQSWAAAVLNSIFRDGWFKPNARLATRALIIPMLLFTVMAVVMPLLLGGIFRWSLFYSRAEAQPSIYRYAYPTALLFTLAAWTVHLVYRRLAAWRISIRDEVYLIGERLHNFSEKRARDVGVSRRVVAR